MAITPEILLVNKDYICEMTSLNKSVDADIIKPSIICAQDMRIEPVLGSALMRAVKDGGYTDLLDNYIRKPLAWWAFADVLGKLYVKADAGGLFMRTAENGEQITPDEYRMKRSEAESWARSYTKKLTDYLAANHASFPELNTNVFPDKAPDGNVYRKGRLRISGGASYESDRLRDKYF